MKISELIRALAEFQRSNGDVEVRTENEELQIEIEPEHWRLSDSEDWDDFGKLIKPPLQKVLVL